MTSRTMRVPEAEDRFILHWGEMAQSWGINRTMGQVHALLFVSARPWSGEEIMDRLQVSRGNVSVTLRSLIEWGLVRRFHRAGERREFYEALADVNEMFRIIVRERKRREFDPTVREVEHLVDVVEDTEDGHRVRERLSDLRSLLRTLDLAFSRFAAGEVDEAAQVLKVEIEGL